MKLIYRTRIQKPNKYERFHNEYYQNGDIIEKYTLSSTRVPGRLEKGESRRRDVKYLSASWHIQDPNMPQWLNHYIDIFLEAPFLICSPYSRQWKYFNYTNT